MQIGPIIQRELRVCLRRPEARRSRNRTVYWSTGISAVLLVVEGFGLPILRYTGFWFFAFTALLAGVQPYAQCLGMIQEERLARTFPLLQLAGVSSREFFAGKALSAVWSCSFQVLGLLPLVALPFLAGGLSYQTFLGMLGFVPSVLVASVGVTLLVSTVIRDETGARVWLTAGLIAWCLGGPLLHTLGRLTTGTAPFGPEILWISPLYAGSLLQDGLTRATQGEFQRSLMLLWVVGLGSMLGAAWWLDRTWRSDELAPTATTSRGSRCRSRQRAAAGAVDDARWNPLQDQVAGETGRLWWPYAGLMSVGLLWLVAAVVWGRPWMASLMGLLLQLSLTLLVAALPELLLAARVARDRQSGAIEELLTTQLTPEQLVSGYVLGIRRLLWPFQLAAGGLAGVFWLAGLLSRSWNPWALLSYVVLGGILMRWLLDRGTRSLYQNFRMAFITGRAASSLRRGATSIAMANLYNLFNFYRLIQSITTAGKLAEFPTGHPIEITAVLFGGLLLFLILREGSKAAPPVQKLATEEMRQIIQEAPIRDDDPRLKRWDANMPFPTGQ